MKFNRFSNNKQIEIRYYYLSNKHKLSSCLKCGTKILEKFSFIRKKNGEWIKYPSYCIDCLLEINKIKRCIICDKIIDSVSTYCKKCSVKNLFNNNDRNREIVDLFNSNNIITAKKIEKIYNLPQPRIQKILSNFEQIPRNKYTLDESALSRDSSFKYYFLGLIATNGYVGNNEGFKYISISLEQDNRVVLEDIKKYLKFNKPLIVRDGKLVLTIYSNKLFDILKSYGIVEQKTYFKITKEIPDKFKINFLQGVFEGSGYISDKPCVDIYFTCINSKVFAEQIKQFLFDLGYELKISSHKDIKENSFYLIKKCGYDGLKILAQMYSNAPAFMPKKYEKFLSHIRLSSDEVFLNMAHEISLRSTCIRAKVGCIITNKDKTKITSVGYNGQASGSFNSCESIHKGMCGCIHAENNALLKNNFGEGTILYCTKQPCLNCSKQIINGGIKEVYFSDFYNNRYSLSLMKDSGIFVKCIPRSSYMSKYEISKILKK